MTGAAARETAVLIVAYGAADMLARCIRSVDRHLPGLAVHVWDNSGTASAGVRSLSEDMPHVHWYLGSVNIGFAAAVNRLAAAAPNCDLLLLNPDAELVGPLSSTFEAIRDSRTAAAGPMVWEPPAGAVRLFSASRTPWDVAHRPRTILNALCETAARSERLRGTALSNLYRSQPDEVDGYLTGACLAIRRDAWDAVGPFDERFFLYGEESDWQRRAITGGWRICLADEIGVRHSARGTVAGDAAASARSSDLLRASVALELEGRYGRRIAELYLVGAFLVERTKRRPGPRRRIEGDGHQRPSDVVITLDRTDSATMTERIALAATLAQCGLAVTVISLQPLGALPREVPMSIRLLRRPWWWLWTWPGDRRAALVAGTTRRERMAALIYRLRRNEVCGEASSALNRFGQTSGTEIVPVHELEVTR